MKRLLVALALVYGCTSTTTTTAPTAQATEPVRIIIVGTTDVHGTMAGRTDTTKSGATVRTGGLATLASYVDALRAANAGRVILVDSGDVFQGTLESNLFEGEPMVLGYNQLGYAAAAVGNHEFDYGPVGPASVAISPRDDELGALRRNASLAKFPFLSANMVERATGQTPSWARKSTIVTAGGVKVGIIGLSTPDTPNVTMASNVVDLAFTDPVKATIDEAAKLRAAGAGAVIVIAHMGGRCSELADPHDTSSCETDQEAVRTLNAIPSGTIDAYFGGHTHAQMRHVVNGTPAMQAAAYSGAFSTLELWVDPAARRVVRDRSILRPPTQLCTVVWSGTESCDARRPPAPEATLVPRTFESRSIEPDPQVAAVLQPFLEKTAAKKNEPTGITASGSFRRRYREESELGNLVTDAMRDAAKTDIAFMNSGGIRTDLRSGALVYNDFFELSPFDNYLAVVEMTGEQVRQILEITASNDRGLLQVSGLRYAFDAKGEKGKRLTSASLEDGRPLDPKATYRVAIPDFLVGGGDGWRSVIAQISPDRIRVDQSRPMRDVLLDTIRAWPMPIAPKPRGRITIANLERGD